MPTISLNAKATPPKAASLLVGLRPGAEQPVVSASGLSASALASLASAAAVLGLTGKVDESAKIPAPQGVSAPVVVFVGLGDKPTTETLRRAVGAAVRGLSDNDSIAIAVPTTSVEQVAAVAEGALLGAYRYTAYRSGASESAKQTLSRVIVVTDDARSKAVKAALARAEVLADAVNATRDLVNCPPNDLYPEKFAELAVAAAKAHGVKASVTDDKALRAGGFGGLTAVGQGSRRGPRLVRLSYSPTKRGGKAGKVPHVALVGKGITFDSGGLSIKPAASMTTMKLDMAGAAAVLNTVVAAARLQLPIEITGYLCLAENMPSGTAQRPSDVITILGGKTVEVLNTDAEGRLVLADGLVSASADNPDAIIDIATLTGAQMVALGNRVSAVMANDDDLRGEVVASAEASGEQFWPMPLPVELRASLDSSVADIANIGDRMGGMLTAGLFLAEFVGEAADGSPIPWAHLDIAGPSFNEGAPWGYTGKGGTGVGVRTMLALLESRAR